MIRHALALGCLIGAAPVFADDSIRFDLDALDGVESWPRFDVEAVQCLFPQASLEERTVPTRFDDGTSKAIVWTQSDEAIVVFEAVGSGSRVFSIWTENPQVIGPYGWQIGATSMAEVQAQTGTCKRGFNAASDRVVCSFPDDLGIPGSFVFKSVSGIEVSASGTYDPTWGDARLSRIERYQGDAPSAPDDCGLSS